MTIGRKPKKSKTPKKPGKRKKAKKWTLKSKLIPAIRRIWFFSPLRREAIKRAEGKCELCHEPQEKFQVDHINPIVPIKEGFTTWDKYIKNTVCCEDGVHECCLSKVQALCKNCHDAKTLVEKELRKNAKSRK